MADIDQIYTGPFSISADSVDLGHTEGGAEVNIEELGRERKVDSYGETVVDLLHLGTNMRVTVRLAEETVANLAIIFPMGINVSSVIYHGGYAPGRKYSAKAAIIVLTSQASDDCEIGLCKGVVEPGSVSAIPLNIDDDRVYEVTFCGLLDENKTEGKRVGWIKPGA